MLTISDIEEALKKYFETKSFKDGFEILGVKGISDLQVTMDETNVVIRCLANEKTFENRIPFDEFKYCIDSEDKEIYMLRLFCNKCTFFLHCASVKKSLRECVGNVFDPMN